MGGISLNVEGQENIDTDQQYIFMVNHQSNVDIPVIVQSLVPVSTALDRQKRTFVGAVLWLGHVGDETYHGRPFRSPRRGEEFGAC